MIGKIVHANDLFIREPLHGFAGFRAGAKYAARAMRCYPWHAALVMHLVYTNGGPEDKRSWVVWRTCKDIFTARAAFRDAPANDNGYGPTRYRLLVRIDDDERGNHRYRIIKEK